MLVLLVFLASLAGVASCAQGATNGALAGRLGLATTILLNAVVVVGGALSIWLIAPRNPGAVTPAPQQWYLFLGGLYGLTIIAVMAFAYPRLGAGPTTALMVAFQLIAALVVDHLGLGTERVSVTPLRLCGVAMLIAGALIVLGPKLTGKVGS